MSQKSAYPLSWPERWPRTERHLRRQSRFGTFSNRTSMEKACDFLSHELDLLNATKQVLSTNVQRRLDGRPYSNAPQPADTGAAIYFELKGRPTALACDRWTRVEDNVWAIAKHIEALRGQQRWGVGSLEQAFTGYSALPAPGESEASNWWRVLGVSINATPEQVKEAYRILAKKHHPDAGGDPEMFLRIVKAQEVFEMQLRQSKAA